MKRVKLDQRYYGGRVGWSSMKQVPCEYAGTNLVVVEFSDGSIESHAIEMVEEYPCNEDDPCCETDCSECCPHDEHDHGICMDCGKDRTDDLIAMVDFD